MCSYCMSGILIHVQHAVHMVQAVWGHKDSIHTWQPSTCSPSGQTSYTSLPAISCITSIMLITQHGS